MKQAQRVVVTGSAGRVGRAAVRELAARGHTVIGFDLRPTPGIPADQSVVATLTDVAAFHQAATGADCIIHLAATPDDIQFPRGQPPHDRDNFLSELVPNNVVAPYQVMEAARTLGVHRVVVASTGQVIDGYLRAGQIPVTTDLLPKPRYLYACTKVFLEALGQVYAKEHKIEVLAVRLGWCPRDAGQVSEIAAGEMFQDVFLSPGDAGRFFGAAVEADRIPGYAVVYATSRYTHQLRYDLSDTKRILGWEPNEKWPAGANDDLSK
jgi:nucleoside-diphosphate-sugar epimerase